MARCRRIRTALPQYERPVINEYNTVGNRIAPPFTSIVKYDLNVPAIKWRVGFGDDPELAARGITGTGAPGLLNGVIVTASGLLFGAGRDNQIRAWDTDTGRQLWSSRFGGDFVGSPVMYEMAGRQYLLVPAASTPPAGPARRGGALGGRARAAATAPAARMDSAPPAIEVVGAAWGRFYREPAIESPRREKRARDVPAAGRVVRRRHRAQPPLRLGRRTSRTRPG